MASLERPRRILLMVKAGRPTDATIDTLLPHLEAGDIVVDGGNAHFEDTRRREAALREHGLHFVGAGVSGGEEGALHGPSIMPGGSRESYDALGPLLEEISAKYEGEPCCAYMGTDGAGHYVKMVHNGIEYADMQFIAEAYDLLRTAGLEPARIAEVFREWNTGDLDSFLIEITAEVLGHVDAATGRPFVDVVADAAEQKGTGRWTVQSALELGVPVNAIAEATFARSASGHARLREGPGGAVGPGSGGRAGRGRQAAGRGRPGGPMGLQGGRLRPGTGPAPGGQRGLRLGGGRGHGGQDLAGRLHHPGPSAGADPPGLRRPGPSHPPGRSGRGRGAGPGPGRLAPGGRAGRDRWRPRARVRLGPGLLRHRPARAAAGGAGPGAARPLRGPTPTSAWTATACSTPCGPRTAPSRKCERVCQARSW